MMTKIRFLRSILFFAIAFSSNNLYAAMCEFTVVNEWGSGFTSSLSITNDTDQTIDGWTASVDFNGTASISGAWNASLSNTTPQQASNESYNAKILPNSTVSFGFNSQKTTSGQSVTAPTLGGICGNSPSPEPEPDPETAQCQYTLVNEWNSGFTSSITITNVEDQAIEGWLALVDFAGSASISHMWNAGLSGSGPYQARNKGYNSTIGSNSSVQFGFNSNKTVQGASVQVPTLGGICGSSAPINTPPTVSATASTLTGTAPLTINFDATASTDPDGDDLSFLWDFGNSNTSTESAVSQTYTAAGTYTVTITVTDSHSASESQDFTITVNDPEPSDSYVLDPDTSSIYFVSTKKVHVIESHTFTELSGGISEDGEAVVQIALDSVDTGIETRNERMRNYLFETNLFSQAEITLDVDMTEIADIPIGETLEQTISPIVNLHGFSIPLEVPVSITKLSASKILVQNTSPVLVEAADFDLLGGVDTLKDLASLSVISYTVPTNFTLFFSTQQ